MAAGQGDISHYAIDKANIIVEALASGLQPITAAQMAGICRATAYNWRKQYPEFAERWEDAIAGATELVEEVVWRHAISGNIAAAFYWLKHHKPRIYNREALAKVAMLQAAISVQAARGGGNLTINIDADGIPQVAENTHRRVTIYMPDNGRGVREIDSKAEPSQEPQEPEASEIKEQEVSGQELPEAAPTDPKPQAETKAQIIERYGPAVSNLDRWKALSE